MLGFMYQGHELRALVFLYIIGFFFSYAHYRKIQRKKIQKNIIHNAEMDALDASRNWRSNDRHKLVEYGWNEFGQSFAAGLLSYIYFIVNGVGWFFDKLSKAKPAKWM